MINETLQIATMFECDALDKYTKITTTFDPNWLHTTTACKILDILQDMYKFKLGFLISQPDGNIFSTLYTKPFSLSVWNCLTAIGFFVTIFFYFLKKWEVGIAGGWETSFSYESLMVIGAYCQHVPPIDPKLPSRRIAYVCFFCFAYIVYTFYTSNLLSHLVNDSDDDISLEMLTGMNFEFAIVDYMKEIADRNFGSRSYNDSFIWGRIRNTKSMTIHEGVKGAISGRVAFLSDYRSIVPYIIQTYSREEICKLTTVDLFTSMKKYLFTSINFRYQEEFKVGTLRIKETGILNRIMALQFETLSCGQTSIETNFYHISIPVTILLVTYVICLIILVLEKIHYKRNKVFPYVE